MMDSAKEKNVLVTHEKMLCTYVAIHFFYFLNFNMAFLIFSLSVLLFNGSFVAIIF